MVRPMPSQREKNHVDFRMDPIKQEEVEVETKDANAAVTVAQRAALPPECVALAVISNDIMLCSLPANFCFDALQWTTINMQCCASHLLHSTIYHGCFSDSPSRQKRSHRKIDAPFRGWIFGGTHFGNFVMMRLLTSTTHDE